jgi:hypothetical protein
METSRIKRTWTAWLVRLHGLAFAAAMLAPGAQAADTIVTLATPYHPTITQATDAAGFLHPGVGVTKEVLENVRTQVRAQQEPWNSHFNAMLLSSAASRTVTSSNAGSDPTRPASLAFSSQGFNGRFIADGLKAYTQALLFHITGDEVYRANAMRILRLWAQMDPAQYAYFTDSHIHTGIPLSRMVAAAEIMRYTSCQTAALAWTDQDTAQFTANLVTPVIETFQHTNWRFMNQHLYPLLGAMSGYIFTGNRERYNEGVEWFTVNRSAVDQGQNGAIQRLFRLVEKDDLTGESVPPVVQHVEMGRDQAHGAGDITNASILARLLISQGTKVDPVTGIASTEADAVGPYEFLDDRILAATEQFSRFMLGLPTPWVPTAAHMDADGNPTVVYEFLSDAYRGRSTQNSWEIFHYYKYVRGIDIEQLAPYTTRFYRDRVTYNWDGVDGGGDYWLFIPAAAVAEAGRYLVKPIVEPYREVDQRFSLLEGNAIAAQDETAAFLRVDATAAGTRLAIYSYAHGSKNIALRVRTNGIATLAAFDTELTLPDTGGQWRSVNFTLDALHGLGDMLFLGVKGAGTRVDIDHINVLGATPPLFAGGSAALALVSYAGSTAPLQYSFAATDPNAGDTVTYQADNLPAGATFNTATGAFSWLPSQAGTYTFVVTASDGSALTSRPVTIVVTANRQAAIDAVIAGYRPDVAYVSATLAAYNAAYAQATAAFNAADAVFAQKLAELQAATAALQQLTPLLADGSIDYAKMFVASSFGSAVPLLLDGTPYTWSTAPAATAPNLAHTIDLGPDFKLAASQFRLQVRVSFPERIGGVAVFGSNDNENWTRLTPELTVVTEQMQTLAVQDDLRDARFRFFKLQMVQPTYSIFELGEMRIVGTRSEAVNRLTSVAIGSDQALKSRIVPGNTVKVVFQSREPVSQVAVTVHGQPASVTSTDNLNWTASWVATAQAPAGAVKFAIRYRTAQGVDADAALFTTDGSSLFIADQAGLIANPLALATLSDSSNRTPAALLTVANTLFDNNLATFTDFRVNGSGSGGWIGLDFRQDNAIVLNRIEIIARQDQYFTRINGAVVQGSNDKAAWTTISRAATSTAEWQTLAATSTQAYRYLRIYNGGNWFGNMAEVKLYGAVGSTLPADVSAGITFTRLGATLNRATGKYVGSVAIANPGSIALAAPLALKLTGLTAGVTLDNASGSHAGAPYIRLDGALAAGASITVPLTFTNPSRSVIGYTPQLVQGTYPGVSP